MNKPVHILRYGTVGEKTQLGRAINAFDYLAINGNSAAYVSRAIAKFIVEKFFSKKDKGFFIDPITYAFQQKIHLLYNKSNKSEKILKKSIKKLIDIYQEPVKKINNDEPILPSDFDEASVLEGFCTRVLDFQYNIISNYIDDNDLKEYLRYAAENMNGILDNFHPEFLIAPYFYLNPNDMDFKKWLNLNVIFINKSIDITKTQLNGCSVFGQIVINKDILKNKNTMELVSEGYKNCNCDGFTIWVDGFNEHEESQDILDGFIYFLHSIRKFHKKPIYNMYGSFFSVLLTHRSIQLLNGVSHGMEYGEYREVYPVGGGLPVSRYYYMPLHHRKDFTKAFYLLEYNKIINTSLKNWGNTERYFKEVCKCEQCLEILNKDMSDFIKFESDRYYEVRSKNNNIIRRKKASPETKENCLYHYLLCKKMEFSMICKMNIKEELEKLKSEKDKYLNNTFLDEDELDYIDHWYNVINNLQED